MWKRSIYASTGVSDGFIVGRDEGVGSLQQFRDALNSAGADVTPSTPPAPIA